MNYNEHNPPHFHARYQDQEIAIEVQTGIVQGKMSIVSNRPNSSFTLLKRSACPSLSYGA
ncbi:MAG: DUF4160 domain-containing protein [bacterium]|nr:DUF4160 domain-containing protein [bacterium]